MNPICFSVDAITTVIYNELATTYVKYFIRIEGALF